MSDINAAQPLPGRDRTKPAEQQGLFRKFLVIRTDGSSGIGGKHEHCENFVLDVNHDPHAPAALAAYANEVERTHPALAADMRQRYALTAVPAQPLTWYDGAPPFPQDQEWFIAETIYGDRVVLRSLDEGREHKGNYAFKTADGTYVKTEVVKRWMQFPDCEYIPPAPAHTTGVTDKAILDAATRLFPCWREDIQERFVLDVGRAVLELAGDSRRQPSKADAAEPPAA